MKKTLFTLIVFGSLQSSAMAIIGGYDLEGCSGLGCPLIACAPEVKQNNLQAADAVLLDLAQGDLRGAPRFTSLVTQAQPLTGDSKIKFYMGLIGVKTNRDLVEFVGARTPDEQYVKALSVSAGISEAQSAVVLSRLSTALAGPRH